MITVNLEGDMNAFTKFSDNPSNSCGDISLKDVNMNLRVALEEKSMITKVSRTGPVRTMNVIHLIVRVVERRKRIE